MGSLSMTASDSHTKYHWPPERCSDLLGDTCATRFVAEMIDHRQRGDQDDSNQGNEYEVTTHSGLVRKLEKQKSTQWRDSYCYCHESHSIGSKDSGDNSTACADKRGQTDGW